MKTMPNQQRSVKPILQDIILDVTWSKIAKRYFGKSSSWIFNKINSYNEEDSFTTEERKQLKEALNDFSKRLATVAANDL